jgi:hypothetical protein
LDFWGIAALPLQARAQLITPARRRAALPAMSAQLANIQTNVEFPTLGVLAVANDNGKIGASK